jgi:hypothetical protein
MTPAAVSSGGSAQLKVESPTADSIEIQSINGLDRYWEKGHTLRARVESEFGDTMPSRQYAIRDNELLFNVLKKPMKVSVCKKGRCREYYHEVPVILPERNERSVAVTGGWSTAFTRRAVTNRDRSVLMKEVLNHSMWNVQAELATGGLSGKLQGFYGAGVRGGSLDVAHQIKRIGDGMGYGLAVRLAATTQLGIYTDGRETLQEVSTFVSLNGGLTEVRTPVTVTMEKTFAFGGEPLIPRRRDALERLTFGWDIVRGFALRLGMTTHRSAWPTADGLSDVRANEVYYTVGGQYTLSW